jgi:hypothetical protein
MVGSMKTGQEDPLGYLQVWHSCRRTLLQVNGEQRRTSRAKLTNIDTDFVPFHRVDAASFLIEGLTERRYALIHDTAPRVIVEQSVAGRATSHTGKVSRSGQIAA